MVYIPKIIILIFVSKNSLRAAKGHKTVPRFLARSTVYGILKYSILKYTILKLIIYCFSQTAYYRHPFLLYTVAAHKCLPPGQLH